MHPDHVCRQAKHVHHVPRHCLAGNIGVLVCDFDETLTEKDSIATLMSVAEVVAAKVRARRAGAAGARQGWPLEAAEQAKATAAHRL
jgi:hypothetical protein